MTLRPTDASSDGRNRGCHTPATTGYWRLDRALLAAFCFILYIDSGSSNQHLPSRQSTVYPSSLPNTRSNSSPANRSTPGLFVHHMTLFALLLSPHPPASPTTSTAMSPSRSTTGRPRRSTMQHPRVHCPLVSTRTSPVLNSHAALPADSAYHTVSGSCSCSPSLDSSWFGFRLSSLRNVVSRNSDDHSASGDPSTGLCDT
jgi:hypothetical protein